MMKVQSAALKTAATPNWTFSPVPAVENAIESIRQEFPQLYPDGLARMHRYMAKLDNPHQKIPFVFHVAGTNGKGSTLAFLQAVFEAAGLSVHKYTSPHLITFDERIIINGRPITPELLLELIAECKTAAAGEQISFFEFFTGLAFLAFSRNPATVVLLETGLGGLNDASNVVEGPHLVSMLTRVAFDHMHILGNTLVDIAKHKCGIIKQGAACVSAPQDTAVAAVVTARAAEESAPLHMNWRVTPGTQGFEYRSAQHTFRLPWPRLQGQHQMYNAGLAIAALESSPYAPLLEQKILEQAMQRVIWPGRLQKVSSGALLRLLPPGWELWLDGAHNDAGAEVLAEQARNWKDTKPLHMITAMKATKDASSFYRQLLPYVSTVQAIETPWTDAPMTAPDALVRQICQLGFAEAKTAATLESAIRDLAFQFHGPQRILITGSLYLVGHALSR